MDKKQFRDDLKDWSNQVTAILSKIAAGQPVTREECDKLADLQGKLTQSIEWATN